MASFYLNSNAIELLKAKKNHFNEANSNLETAIRFYNFNNTLLSSLERPLIVQVVNIQPFKEVDTHLLIELYDGTDSEQCLILRECLDDQNKKQDTNAEFKIGHVIIINEVKCLRLRDILQDFDDYNLIKHLCITSIHLIGWCPLEDHFVTTQTAIVNTLEEPKTLESEEQKHSQNENNEDDKMLNCLFQTPSHQISTLEPSLSNSDWSINVILKEKTNLKLFTNSKTNKSNAFIRLYFVDELTGNNIEAVAFEPRANELSVSLQVNFKYYIRRAEIKEPSSRGYRQWPTNHLSSKYNIVIKEQSIIEPICMANTEKKPQQDDISSCCNASNAANIEEEKTTNKRKTRMEKASELDDIIIARKTKEQQKTYQEFVPIDQLIYRKFETLVNVIGIIESVKDATSTLDRLDRAPLTIRNFNLIDRSKVFVKCALWGKQAETFTLRPGTVVIMRQVKITNYGGLSLSVLKCTTIQDVKDPDETWLPEIKDLYSWWRDEWWTSRKTETNKSINSLLQSKNKRPLDSIQEFDAHKSSDNESGDYPSPQKKRKLG